MTLKRRLYTIIVIAVIMMSMLYCFGSVAVANDDVIDSGSCGDNATWTLTGTSTDMTLTISGTGAMQDLTKSMIPWGSRRSKIKRLVVEEGITSLGDYAFYSVNKLTEVSLPPDITSIGSYCFANEVSLTSIDIPKGVSRIGEYAFCDCSRLTDISIPVGVAHIGEHAFCGCSRLTDISIPEGVTDIEAYTFGKCSSLKTIDLPDGLAGIGHGAFSDCSSLESINIPDSVSSIGGYAFSACYSLHKVYITDLKSYLNIQYDSYASPFDYGADLYIDNVMAREITIPEGVTGIGAYAFYGYSGLESITIPDSVNSIGEDAFCNCFNLHKVYITDLKSYLNIQFESSPTCQGTDLYIDNVMAREITIPEGVTSVGYGSFNGCSSLTSVNIPDSVTSIESYAFSGCSSLTSVNIPDSVTSIESYAFSGCSSLTSVNIPDSVTSIESCAFSGCSSLKSITIPDSVTSIGEDAFSDCGNPKYVFFAGSEEQWNKNGLYRALIAIIHYNATDHTWSRRYSIVKKPTCKRNGIKARICVVCGAINDNSKKAIPKIRLTLPTVKITATKAAKRSATINWKKVSKKNKKKITKIQIQYSPDKHFKKSVKSVYAKKTAVSKKITNLGSGKKYYVRVRAYRKSGDNVYISKWSAVKSVKAR